MSSSGGFVYSSSCSLRDIRQHIAAVSSFIYDNNAPFISRVRPRIERDQSTKLLWGVGGDLIDSSVIDVTDVP